MDVCADLASAHRKNAIAEVMFHQILHLAYPLKDPDGNDSYHAIVRAIAQDALDMMARESEKRVDLPK